MKLYLKAKQNKRQTSYSEYENLCMETDEGAQDYFLTSWAIHNFQRSDTFHLQKCQFWGLGKWLSG